MGKEIYWKTYDLNDFSSIYQHLQHDTSCTDFFQPILRLCSPIIQWLCEKCSVFSILFKWKQNSNSTHFGSQCAIVKLKLMRVTNISVSKRISCTDGGGSAIAKATIPKSGGWDFRVCEYEYCGRKRHNNRTTCKI